MWWWWWKWHWWFSDMEKMCACVRVFVDCDIYTFLGRISFWLNNEFGGHTLTQYDISVSSQPARERLQSRPARRSGCRPHQASPGPELTWFVRVKIALYVYILKTCKQAGIAADQHSISKIIVTACINTTVSQCAPMTTTLLSSSDPGMLRIGLCPS